MGIHGQRRYAALPHLAPRPQPLPRVRAGERLPIASLRVEAGMTEPPPPLSESDLIGEMESHGIGTDASIATHIKNVEARRYVRLLAGRRLEPTALGLALVQGRPPQPQTEPPDPDYDASPPNPALDRAPCPPPRASSPALRPRPPNSSVPASPRLTPPHSGYRRVDAELVLPTVRSHVEQQLNSVASGAVSRAVVVAHCLAEFERKYAYLVRKVGQTSHSHSHSHSHSSSSSPSPSSSSL